MAAVFVFTLICRELRFSRTAEWLGFIGLFINFMVLKRFIYYSVSTDPFAFLCGLLLVYFYLKRSLSGMLFATLLMLEVFCRVARI